MKYFGFYLDLSYHRLDVGREQMTSKGTMRNFPNLNDKSQGFVPAGINNNFWSEGDAFTLAFMFAARYGFLKDSEVPFGRLQPYLGVGPAILFSSMHPSLQSAVNNSFPQPYAFGGIRYTLKPESDSAVNLALAVEAGLRWMALKNVSVDLSFKYRYAKPSYTFNYTDRTFFAPINPPINTSFTLSPTLHIMSFQLGAAYHF
jgi:opacity protein-like surface antigen